jgi:hypothetical protein
LLKPFPLVAADVLAVDIRDQLLRELGEQVLEIRLLDYVAPFGKTGPFQSDIRPPLR